MVARLTAARPLGASSCAGPTASEIPLGHAFEDTVVGRAIADPDGRFVRVNAAFRRMVGRGEATLLAWRFEEVVHRNRILGQLMRWQERSLDSTRWGRRPCGLSGERGTFTGDVGTIGPSPRSRL